MDEKLDLNELREKLEEYSDQEVAVCSGLCLTTIWNFRTGKSIPHRGNRKKIRAAVKRLEEVNL